MAQIAADPARTLESSLAVVLDVSPKVPDALNAGIVPRLSLTEMKN
jgi:hypothetical protein